MTRREEARSLESPGALLGNVLIDRVRFGDNAVVIGMAARNLSPENRHRAIVFGGAAAVTLRILFTALAMVLLNVPLLHAFGGVLLAAIAGKHLMPDASAQAAHEAGSLRDAIR